MADDVLENGKPAGCAECPRLELGVRCRASSPRPEGTAEVLFVFSQPEKEDCGVEEPGTRGSAAAVVKQAIFNLYKEESKYQQLFIRNTYAAQCIPAKWEESDGSESSSLVVVDDKPNMKVLTACAPRMWEVVNETQPKLIVAFGAIALKQLGIMKAHKDVRGRVLEPDETGLEAPVLVTFSERALAVAAGLFVTFTQDLRNGLNRVIRGTTTNRSLAELSANYEFPANIDEAIALCDKIRLYTEGTTPVDAWAISIDTETTTLRPEKEDARIIGFCFAWGTGRATTILYDHPFAPQEYLERLPELEVAIRALLACGKPKILHNAKFDLKFIECKYEMPVTNVAWCTLLGEHLLDEDKKGNYGLKGLTAVWIPHFCGYEDKLFDLLSAVEEGILTKIDEKIDAVVAVAGAEHAPYIAALKAHRDALLEHEELAKAHDAELREYEAALQSYQEALYVHKRAVEEWETLPRRPKKPVKPKKLPAVSATDSSDAQYLTDLRHYDEALERWENWPSRPAKPVFELTKPAKPDKLAKAPKEPEDPRTKKEIQYTTDGGFEKLPLEDLQTYGAVDGDVTRQLAILQIARLKKEAYESHIKMLAATRPNTSEVRAAILVKEGKSKVPLSQPLGLMRTHAIPASRVLGRMEYEGTSIDQKYIPVLMDGLTQVIDRTFAELTQMSKGFLPGDTCNLASSKQLAELLYDHGWRHPDGTRMDVIPCTLKTKTGARSTAEAAFKPFIQYDLIEGRKVATKESYFLEQLLLWKKALKARDTFLLNLRILSKRDGKIHTSFHLNGTGTGRLSCISANTRVVTSRGNVAARKLKPGNMILTQSGAFYPLKRVFLKGEERMHQYGTVSGAMITCTEEHRLWTTHGWMTAKQLWDVSAASDVLDFMEDMARPRLLRWNGTRHVWDHFTTRVDKGVQPVWDLEIGDEEYSYVTKGGLISHNSSDMNLQNVPKALGGFNIKKLFIPDDPETMFFVNADYKGAEVRVFTAYAKDPALEKALNDGLDMHSFFASKVYGRPYEDYENRGNKNCGLSAEYRARCDKERTAIKRTVFGILYGAGEKKIAETCGLDEAAGKALIATLFEMFPGIKQYILETHAFVEKFGYVETHTGRRRRFPLVSRSRHRSRAQRQACNFKVQSTSSDIVISQLIEIAEAIASDKTWPEWGIHRPLHTYGVRLLLTVHDSIGLQWPKELAHSLTPWLTYYAERRVREKFPWLPVPFKVDIEAGPSYGELKPMHEYLESLPYHAVVEGAIEEMELLTELKEDAFMGEIGGAG